MKNKNGFTAIGIVGVFIVLSVLLGSGFWYARTSHRAAPPAEKPVVCTHEVKQCPDGSYVSRTGPNCEFAECPEPKSDQNSPASSPSISAGDTSTWKTYRNEKYGFEIRFPSDAILSVDDLSLGAAGHKTVQVFSPNASYITISSDGTFVSVCSDCGGGGLGIGDERVTESVTLGTKIYGAAGYYHNDQESTSKVMTLDFTKFSVVYGFRSNFRHPFSEAQILYADELSKKILRTLVLQ